MKAVLALIGVSAVAGLGAVLPEQKAVKPTYSGQVAAILNKNCVSCHRPGEVAPFSLVGYENAKKWSKMVAEVTSKKLMPPWRAVDHFGEFKDVARISEADAATLAKWAELGAPQGNPKRVPATPKFPVGWSLGEPDMVVGLQKPYKLAAEGKDVYRYFLVKTNFKESRWVRAAEARPDNKRVVHHIITWVDTTGMAAKYAESHQDGQPGYSFEGGPNFIPNTILGVWAPGFRTVPTPKDTAFELKPGATIVLQVHYNKSGKEELDSSKVGIYFDKQPPKKVMHVAFLDNGNLAIPAGETNYKHSADFRFASDKVTLYGVMPHMHLLGRTMKAVVKKESREVPLIQVADWDFNWQLQYLFKEPIKLEGKFSVNVSATFDNSSKNPRNPNTPPKAVWWGEGTRDEMCLLVVLYTNDSEPVRRSKD